MQETLTVGTILKPQGIRGEVKVKPFTDSAEDFKEYKRVLLGGEEYKILSCRGGDGVVFLSLRGVPDRNAAELLRGKDVVVQRDELPALEEGRYYIADLLGCSVVTEGGKQIGTLTDVRPASCDVYTVSAGGKEILFPAAEGVVLEVDIDAGKIVVSEKRFQEVAVL